MELIDVLGHVRIGLLAGQTVILAIVLVSIITYRMVTRHDRIMPTILAVTKDKKRRYSEADGLSFKKDKKKSRSRLKRGALTIRDARLLALLEGTPGYPDKDKRGSLSSMDTTGDDEKGFLCAPDTPIRHDSFSTRSAPPGLMSFPFQEDGIPTKLEPLDIAGDKKRVKRSSMPNIDIESVYHKNRDLHLLDENGGAGEEDESALSMIKDDATVIRVRPKTQESNISSRLRELTIDTSIETICGNSNGPNQTDYGPEHPSNVDVNGLNRGTEHNKTEFDSAMLAPSTLGDSPGAFSGWNPRSSMSMTRSVATGSTITPSELGQFFPMSPSANTLRPSKNRRGSIISVPDTPRTMENKTMQEFVNHLQNESQESNRGRRMSYGAFHFQAHADDYEDSYESQESTTPTPNSTHKISPWSMSRHDSWGDRSESETPRAANRTLLQGGDRMRRSSISVNSQSESRDDDYEDDDSLLFSQQRQARPPVSDVTHSTPTQSRTINKAKPKPANEVVKSYRPFTRTKPKGEMIYLVFPVLALCFFAFLFLLIPVVPEHETDGRLPFIQIATLVGFHALVSIKKNMLYRIMIHRETIQFSYVVLSIFSSAVFGVAVSVFCWLISISNDEYPLVHTVDERPFMRLDNISSSLLVSPLFLLFSLVGILVSIAILKFMHRSMYKGAKSKRIWWKTLRVLTLRCSLLAMSQLSIPCATIILAQYELSDEDTDAIHIIIEMLTMLSLFFVSITLIWKDSVVRELTIKMKLCWHNTYNTIQRQHAEIMTVEQL